jgi:hypothetical protein
MSGGEDRRREVFGEKGRLCKWRDFHKDHRKYLLG